MLLIAKAKTRPAARAECALMMFLRSR